MNTPSQIYKWQPADERLVRLLLSNTLVVLKNADGDIGTANVELLMELCGCVNPTVEQATAALALRKIEYLPPTAPEVLELPDCTGWWWVFYAPYGHPKWNPRFLKSVGSRLVYADVVGWDVSPTEGHYVNATLYPRPDFNP